MTGTLHRPVLALASLLLFVGDAPAAAHGLLLKLEGDGAVLRGALVYSDGAPAAGEWVEVTDRTSSTPPRPLQTDRNGRFELSGRAGHRYQVTASGEEGHSTVMAIRLEDSAAGAAVGLRPAASAAARSVPLAATLIGVALILAAATLIWLQRLRRKR